MSENKWNENPINALQEYFQSPNHRILGDNKQPILPRYKTVDAVQASGSQIITIALILPTGETIYTSAKTAAEAKREAALHYARENLNIGEPKNKDLSKSKTSAPRGYYQLGDVFSVDDGGNVRKLPKTEYQIFLGPDLWLGRVKKKFTLYQHERPLASFEWGKSLIYGGGTFNEEKFRDALGSEISRKEFFDIMIPLIEKQDKKTNYALYRGIPGTPLEQARRFSYMRPATLEEFQNTVDGFLEYYELEDKIKEAEKRTHGTHGGNRWMLEDKVFDLEEEQSNIDRTIIENKNLFRKPTKKERSNKDQHPTETLMAARLREALQK